MFENLFGAEMPLAVRFFLAFLVVLGLIGISAWAIRRFGAGRLGGGAARGRQPRLAVIDYAAVDGRRKLILVRRDNVEHLLMIGGPTDVVVEPNIVRAAAATVARPTAGIGALPRAIPLPEAGSNGTWPLQPRVELQPEELPTLQPARPAAEAPPPPRPQRGTLAALADELSTRPTTQPRKAPAAARPHAAEPRAEIKPEPRMAPPEPPAPAAPIVPPAPPKPAAAEPAQTADQSLADMAQRLEAALRKPSAAPEGRPPRPTPTPSAEQGQPSDAAPAMPRPPRPAEPKPPRPEAKPGQGKTTLYDSLEQEMASLLGRQTKT